MREGRGQEPHRGGLHGRRKGRLLQGRHRRPPQDDERRGRFQAGHLQSRRLPGEEDEEVARGDPDQREEGVPRLPRARGGRRQGVRPRCIVLKGEDAKTNRPIEEYRSEMETLRKYTFDEYQNTLQTKARKNAKFTSNFRGVRRHVHTAKQGAVSTKWRAEITKNGKKQSLGYHDTEEGGAGDDEAVKQMEGSTRHSSTSSRGAAGRRRPRRPPPTPRPRRRKRRLACGVTGKSVGGEGRRWRRRRRRRRGWRRAHHRAGSCCRRRLTNGETGTATHPRTSAIRTRARSIATRCITPVLQYTA